MSDQAFRRTVLRIVATLALAGTVAACGYKGPLYLPSGSAADRKSEPPEAPPPVPKSPIRR